MHIELLESNDLSSYDTQLILLATKFGAVMRTILIYVVYLVAFIILDSRSHALEVFPGVVAWYPPDGYASTYALSKQSATNHCVVHY